MQERIFDSSSYFVKAGAVMLLLAGTVYAGLLVSHAQARSGEAIADYIRNVVHSSRTGLGAAEEVRLAHVIVGESKAHNVDPLLMLALIKTESEFNNWSRSSKGALGLMQILPSTGQEIAGRLSLQWRGEATLFDPYMNVKLGVYYFKFLRNRYNHDDKLSLAAYNAGPGRVSAMMEAGTVSAAFSDRVMVHYKELKKEAEGYGM